MVRRAQKLLVRASTWHNSPAENTMEKNSRMIDLCRVCVFSWGVRFLRKAQGLVELRFCAFFETLTLLTVQTNNAIRKYNSRYVLFYSHYWNKSDEKASEM